MSDKEQKMPGEESDTVRPQDGAEQAMDDNQHDGGADPNRRMQELAQELEAAKARAEDNWNQFVRSRAELENIRRRMERDVSHARKFGLEKIAADLLPVKDSMEMGLQAAQEEGAEMASLIEGSELTLKMLAQLLERFNIAEVNPHGEKFDPEKHEALAMQPSADHEPNTVMHVVQKGYTLHDRLLRPAMVIVARPAEGKTDTPSA